MGYHEGRAQTGGEPVSIEVRRIYDPPSKDDGYRVLVDRLWPRGLTHEDARIDLWLKDIAPSDILRKWFDHDPARWDEFRVRYHRELDERRAALHDLLHRSRTGRVTLLHGSRETRYNNAVALKEYLESRSATR
jgi:uncharacterized protein YeaO (DUF488 family)